MTSHDSDLSSASFDFIAAFNHWTTVSYLNVSVCILLAYDFLLRMDLEVEYIWRYPWSLFKLLYLVQRYLPFVDTFIFLPQQHFGIKMSLKECTMNYGVVFYLSSVGIAFSNIIQSILICCTWRRSNVVKMIIIGLTLGCLVPALVAADIVTRSLEFFDVPLPHFHGCMIVGGENTYMPWVAWLIYDTGAALLMLIPGIYAYREGGLLKVAKTMYQDGVIYFVLMFMLSVINILVMTVLPPDYTFILGPFERVLHCILTSRMIIHIRQVASRNHSTCS